MSPEGKLDTSYLPFEVKKHPLEFLENHTLPYALGIVEKYLITKKLTRFAGNQTKTSEALGISEGTLRYKMRRYGLLRKSF